MKKIVPILLAVALALALCLVGFADAERYDDDPLEESSAKGFRCPKIHRDLNTQ